MLGASSDLTEEQRDIVLAVREFVDKDVIPHASKLEHADEFNRVVSDFISSRL